MYELFTLLGMLAAVVVARRVPGSHSGGPSPARRTSSEATSALRVAAIVGAGLGAHAAHMIPAALGWLDDPSVFVKAELAGAGPVGSGSAGSALSWARWAPLYGRSVLGGILGGWGAVELGKWFFSVRGSVGAFWAAPLAIALCLGRVGCLLTGCCGGRSYAGPFAVVDRVGVARFPAQGIEIVFHGLAFVVLYRRARGRRANELDLVAYFAAYGALRFWLEGLRWHRVFVFGLTFYQLLGAMLFILAGAMWLWRVQRRMAWGSPRPAHLQPQAAAPQEKTS